MTLDDLQLPPLDPDACDLCGLPLRQTVDEGCTAANCSCRPAEYSDEWCRSFEAKECAAAILALLGEQKEG